MAPRKVVEQAVETKTEDPKPTPEEMNAMLVGGASGGQELATTSTEYDDLEEMDPQDSEFGLGDVAVPRIKILQDLSPQTKKTKAQFVEGARPGMFFNSATEELWTPEPGLIIIPCAFLVNYTEWLPRGEEEAGFVADRTDEEGVVDVWLAAFNRRKEYDPPKVLLPNGNTISRSKDHYVLLASASTPGGPYQEAVLGLSGTQDKKSKKFLALITSRRLMKVDPRTRQLREFQPLQPAFSYHVTSKEESNRRGTWMGWLINPGSPTLQLPSGRNLYERGKAFRQLVLEGKRRAAVDEGSAPEERGDVIHDEAETYTPAGRPREGEPF